MTPSLKYALRLLNYRGRSEKELSERLARKGFEPQAIGETVGYLKERGLLDDGAFAQTLKGRAEEVKLLGLFGARQYLRRMGIGDDEAEEALGGYDELPAAEKLMDKKIRTMRGRPLLVQKRRLSGMLQRRGFSAETVRKAIADLQNAKNDD